MELPSMSCPLCLDLGHLAPTDIENVCFTEFSGAFVRPKNVEYTVLL